MSRLIELRAGVYRDGVKDQDIDEKKLVLEGRMGEIREGFDRPDRILTKEEIASGIEGHSLGKGFWSRCWNELTAEWRYRQYLKREVDRVSRKYEHLY